MIKINCSNINYCVGPCNNTHEETTDHKWLKPFSGGRYEQFIWKTKTLKIKKISLELRMKKITLKVASLVFT